MQCIDLYPMQKVGPFLACFRNCANLIHYTDFQGHLVFFKSILKEILRPTDQINSPLSKKTLFLW